MPPRRWRRVILVRGACVENVLIREELDVADLEYHVERFAQADLLEDVGGFELLRGKGRNLAFVAEAREGADVVGVPPTRTCV